MKHTGKANFPRNNSNSILILNIAGVVIYAYSSTCKCFSSQ